MKGDPELSLKATYKLPEESKIKSAGLPIETVVLYVIERSNPAPDPEFA